MKFFRKNVSDRTLFESISFPTLLMAMKKKKKAKKTKKRKTKKRKSRR